MSEPPAETVRTAPGETVETPPTASGGPGGPAPDVSAVSIALKLPPFWPADPELWFAQVEAQFAYRKITSQRSKFDYVVSSLAPEFAAEVRDLLVNPPADNPYTTLKTQLTKRTTASEQKLQLLFTSEELGDRKPTQLLRRLQQLLGNRSGIDGSFLRELFLQRLPPNVRMVLASSPEGTGLEQLTELADKVMEVAVPTPPPIAAVTTSPTLAEEVGQLCDNISRLEKMIKSLAQSRSHSNTRSSRRPSSPSPTNASDTTDPPRDSDSLCWYHSKFGTNAQKCRAPCSWTSNSTAGH